MALIEIVLPVFLVIGLGLALRYLGLVTDATNSSLSRLVFYVASPCLLLRSISQSELDWQQSATMLGVVAGITLGAAFVIYALVRPLPPDRRGVFAQGAIRSNTVFVGLPVVLNAFGEAGLATAGILIAFMVVLENPLSVLLLTLPHQRRSARELRLWLGTGLRILLNPLVLGAGGGILLSVFSLDLPTSLGRSLELVGQTAAPLGLLCVGAGLDFGRLRAELGATAWASLIKLAVYPALILVTLRAVGLAGLALNVTVVICACPTAVISYIMARELRGSAQLASAIVIGTTLASLATLVAWLVILGVG